MSSRKKLSDRISKKEQEIQELEIQIREARAYVQALQEAIKVLPKDDEGRGGDAESTLRPGSAVAEAREAILRHGHPLHINDILQALGRGQDRKNRAAVSGSLAAYVRREQIFTRPRPNTFGLVEMEDVSNSAISEQPSDTPPPDFGLDPDSDEIDVSNFN